MRQLASPPPSTNFSEVSMPAADDPALQQYRPEYRALDPAAFRTTTEFPWPDGRLAITLGKTPEWLPAAPSRWETAKLRRPRRDFQTA
jgi:hypothetical protein